MQYNNNNNIIKWDQSIDAKCLKSLKFEKNYPTILVVIYLVTSKSTYLHVAEFVKALFCLPLSLIVSNFSKFCDKPIIYKIDIYTYINGHSY